MKKRIFISIYYLEIGGAERALLGLLSSLDPSRVEVDLFVCQHTGEFMNLIPNYVNLLPQIPKYTTILRPISAIIKEGHIDIALLRLFTKLEHRLYVNKLTQEQAKNDQSIFQYVLANLQDRLPSLDYLGEYDMAISFIAPHNIVLKKVRAKKKICWIHTDYSTMHVDKQKELPVWKGFDHIISISEECSVAFANTFPELKEKLFLIENILSPVLIRQQAEVIDVHCDMPVVEGETRILSIGRYSPAKNFEIIPRICADMERLGVNFKWFIIGYGDDSLIQQALDKYRMWHKVVLLGKKTNPYPYIKACDIYIQPSLYEGKSIAVREAQILRKPVLITNYATAKSQVQDGVDGVIIPQNSSMMAKYISEFIKNKDLQRNIIQYLDNHDYGNEKEVDKIYTLL